MTATTPHTPWRPNAAVYIASAALSLLGNSIANVVWVWLVLDRTGDPAAAGTVAAVISIPALLFSFLGGALIDRVGRQRMSVISDVISAASVAALVMLDSRIDLTLGWFIALGIIGAAGDVPGMAARQALIGDVARHSGLTLDRLSGLTQTVSGVAFLIGPAAGGVLLSLLPTSSALWITAACSAAAAVLTALLRVGTPAETTNTDTDTASARTTTHSRGIITRTRGELAAWRSIIAHPQIRLIAVTTFGAALLVMPYLIILTPAHFHRIDNPTGYGITTSCYAVGMMLGGLIIARIGTQRRSRVWTTAILLDAVAFGLLAWLAGGWSVALAFALAGIGGGMSNPLTTVVVTEKTPESVRGRAFSMFSMLQLISQPIGLALVAHFVDRVGIYSVAVGISVCAMPLMTYAVIAGLRHFERTTQQTQ